MIEWPVVDIPRIILTDMKLGSDVERSRRKDLDGRLFLAFFFEEGRKERSMMKITIYTSLRYTEGERRKKYQGDFSWCNSVLYLRCENFRYLYTFVRIKCWITRCISRSRWKMCEWFFFFFFLTGRISPNKQRDIYYREKNWTVEIFPNITRLRLINPRN